MYLRVDDRLVHGQIVTAWLRQLKSKVIIVVDKEAASNRIIASALKMASPKNAKLYIVDTEGVPEILSKYKEDELLIITKFPSTAKKVIDENPGYKWTVNVGNVGMAQGRKEYSKSVFLDETNYEAVCDLKENENVDIFMQTVPGQRVNYFN